MFPGWFWKKGRNHTMVNLGGVVRQLQLERQRAQNEVRRFDAALAALGALTSGKASAQKRRTMSASARKRIAAAQRKRWKLWKAEKKAA
jgi:hypothetical protein